MSAPACVACGDTGRNSQGGPCGPCQRRGRQPLRDTLLAGIGRLWDEYDGPGPGPGVEECLAFVRWAYRPRIMYAAGRKARGSAEVGMFAGPCDTIDAILEVAPKPEEEPAYIIKLTRPLLYGDVPTHEPVAKWVDGQWRKRKQKPKRGV